MNFRRVGRKYDFNLYLGSFWQLQMEMPSPYLIFRLGWFKTVFKWGSLLNSWLKCELWVTVYHGMYGWLNINDLYKGHSKEIRSMCWDPQGQRIASVTEDCARVWSIAVRGQYLHEYKANGKRFQSIIFHPRYPNVLVIGAFQVIKLSSFAVLLTVVFCFHMFIPLNMKNFSVSYIAGHWIVDSWDWASISYSCPY